MLAALALVLGIATFALLAGSPWRRAAGPGVALVLANLIVLLLLGAVLAGRLTRVWVERRRGSAGSRLHVRLVLLFSVVAVDADHRRRRASPSSSSISASSPGSTTRSARR